MAFAKKRIGNKRYEDCLTNVQPETLPSVNLGILRNKDGHYGVRPLTLANPYLYYFLVRELTNSKSWEKLKDCFKAYSTPHIKVCALPIVPEKAETFHRSSTILHWWNEIEQHSIELSLEYRYMFVSDITNCYGCINPQSIEWALLCKGTQHENNKNLPMAQNLCKYLLALQQGRNIGIPQGSTLFDIIAEILLGYSDLLLHEKLENEGITGYEVLRYRDDYRIFCNDKDTLERISYILQGVLESLNFRLNSQKTKITDSIVTDSVKPDKLFYLYNTPIYNKKGIDFDSFEKHLLFILMFGRQFPNAGQLKTLLSDLDKRIEERLKPKKKKKGNDKYIILLFPNDDGAPSEEQEQDQEEECKSYLPGGSVRAMAAVAAQIAYENVLCSHYALRIISRMVSSLQDEEEKKSIINAVYQKLCKQPNSDYNQLWLQNITYQWDKTQHSSPYTLRLCQLVMEQTEDTLWNLTWLKPELTEGFPTDTIVDSETLKNLTPVITFRERRAYDEAAAKEKENGSKEKSKNSEQDKHKSKADSIFQALVDKGNAIIAQREKEWKEMQKSKPKEDSPSMQKKQELAKEATNITELKSMKAALKAQGYDDIDDIDFGDGEAVYTFNVSDLVD